MNIDNLKQKAKDAAGQHGDKVEGAMDRGADQAKQRFGHEEEIDSATERGREFLDRGRQEPR